jgi:hypothetical protein
MMGRVKMRLWRLSGEFFFRGFYFILFYESLCFMNLLGVFLLQNIY